MRLKKYKKKTWGTYATREVIVIILGIICSVLVINYFANKFNNVMMPLAEARTRKYITIMINSATDNIKFDKNLFAIEKNDNNEIKMINYNSYEATKLINEITYNIQDGLNLLDNSKDNNEISYIVSEIPFGVIFNNSLMRNFGPKIKVRLDIIGDVISKLQTEVKPYGINNALVEVRVSIECNARVILPFISKEIKVKNIIPISINIVNGSIPEAYISSYR